MFCRGLYLHSKPFAILSLDRLPAALVRVASGKTFDTYRCLDPVWIEKKPIK